MITHTVGHRVPGIWFCAEPNSSRTLQRFISSEIETLRRLLVFVFSSVLYAKSRSCHERKNSEDEHISTSFPGCRNADARRPIRCPRNLVEFRHFNTESQTHPNWLHVHYDRWRHLEPAFQPAERLIVTLGRRLPIASTPSWHVFPAAINESSQNASPSIKPPTATAKPPSCRELQPHVVFWRTCPDRLL